MDKDIRSLLKSENEQLTKLHNIVKKAIDDEKLIVDSLTNPPKELLTEGQKISDKVARFGGSWSFIILFFIVLVMWILFNSYGPNSEKFDPYPYILMNLILSCIAALQAPIIMMSQNRKESKDRKRSENDYLINLKAEIEIRTLHQKINLLMKDELESLFKIQKLQTEMLQRIEAKLNSK